MSDAEYSFSGFERIRAQWPDKTALIFLGERFSYARLGRLVDRLAGGLAGLGIRPGDRVMIYLANSVQLVLSFLALQKIGAATVMVSPIYTSHELDYMIRDSGATAVICHDTNFGYVQDILPGSPLKHVIVTHLLDLLPAYKKIIARLFDLTPHGKVNRGPATLPFLRLLRGPAVPPKVEIDPLRDLSYILYTGGTTGFPKGVPGNHWGHCSYISDIMDEVLAGQTRPGQDVYVAVNPLFHIMALGFFLALGLNQGNATVLMPAPQIDAILAAIGRYQARWLLGVPTLYRMILENDRLDMYHLKSLRYCYCGGDVLPAEVYNRWRERFGVAIHQVYGSTEVGHVAYTRPAEGEPPAGSVGRPLKSRECLVVNPETLEPLGPDEVGELVVTSSHSLKHYWNKPAETAETFVEVAGQTCYRTRDFVRRDQAGFIYFVERSADILKHKGYRVSASEVEAVLQNHEAVVGACVVGVPDVKVGERIKAIVVLKSDAKGVGAADLIKFCRERLAVYKVPSYIEFRDMLPKSKVGKLLRREIRDEERRKLEADKPGKAPTRTA